MTHYNENEITYKTFDGIKRPICPSCINHKQLESGDYDCKNTYGVVEYEPGKFTAKGQCCCYSKEHK